MDTDRGDQRNKLCRIELKQFVYLDHLIPSARDDDGVLVVGAEPDAGNPVVVGLFLNGVLALSQGVPQLNGLVPGPRNDLPVVGGEGHGEDLLGVGLEPAIVVCRC